MNAYSESLQKISSGLRINKASDDASGLAIADKLRTQASSVYQGIKNANSAIAMIQIGDKAMNEQSNIIDMVKTKLVQASTSTTNDEGREAIRKDIVKLLEQLDNIANQTNYNGTSLLQKSRTDDSTADTKTFQIGDKAGDTISMDTVRSNTQGLGLDTIKALGTGALTQSAASGFLDDMDSALSTLNSFRSELGSTQVQLESSVRYMNTMHTNLKESESIIRDVDYAQEVANLSKLQILAQAGMFTISQANKIREDIVSRLLR